MKRLTRLCGFRYILIENQYYVCSTAYFFFLTCAKENVLVNKTLVASRKSERENVCACVDKN